MSDFTSQLILTIFNSQFAYYQNNYDYLRFGPKEKLNIQQYLKLLIERICRKLGIYNSTTLNSPNISLLHQWTPLFSELNWLYSKLEEKKDRDLLVSLIAYRLMGEKAVKLPLNNPNYWEKIAQLKKLKNPLDYIEIKFNNWKIEKHNLNEIGFPVEVYLRTPGVLCTFVLQQYKCSRAGIELKKDQVVLDCGGCFGDTALYFAHYVGQKGKVYSFEFLPSNLTVMKQNLSLNPKLADSIEIVENPVWIESDIKVFSIDRGPATRIGFEPFESEKEQFISKTITIDDFVANKYLERVDLIKMDIEGAEFEALKGAKKTIQQFKPNLALCVYHRPDDFVRLARFIDSLELGYRFYLEHFTIHSEETVLYAISCENEK